jgi:hypothetical protein
MRTPLQALDDVREVPDKSEAMRKRKSFVRNKQLLFLPFFSLFERA